MESLDSILSRVLQNSAEKVAQRIEPAMNRRPLRDPQTNTVGFFQDISAAVRNIQSPEVAGAMRSQAMMQSSLSNQGGSDSGFDDNGSESAGASSSSADRSRRTTIADDVSVIGQIANSATQIVRQIATAGKAIGEFSGNTGKLNKAVSGMAQSVVAADKDVKASKPTEGFMGWLKSLAGNGGANGGASSGSGTAGSGRAGSWLESSSIADSIRGVAGRFRVSPFQMMGMNLGGGGGSVPLAQQDPGNGETLISRISQSFDKVLAKSSTMFRGMGRQSAAGGGSGGNGGGGGDGNDDQNWLNSSSIANSVRGFGRKTIGRMGRMGRRILSSPALRQRLINGRRMLRGGGGAGAGGGGGAAGGGGGGIIRGGLGWLIPPAGGGGGAAAGGAGGAAAGGAAGGAGIGSGMMIAGVVLGFVAIAAAAATVVSALVKLGMQGYETALRVAQFDGQLAGAKAQLDVSRMMREIQTAKTLSDSGAGFMKALDKLEAAMRPVTDGALDVGLRALTEIVLLLTDTFHALTSAMVTHLKITDFLMFGAIPNELIQRIENAVNGPAALPPNVNQLGFMDAQLRERPRRPRAPLPPMGGGNGN